MNNPTTYINIDERFGGEEEVTVQDYIDLTRGQYVYVEVRFTADDDGINAEYTLDAEFLNDADAMAEWEQVMAGQHVSEIEFDNMLAAFVMVAEAQ